jgi:hypothetical protein
MDRLIGRKDILPVIEELYDIHTWRGALLFIQKNKLPIRYTPAGRPFFLKSELTDYDIKFNAK